MFQSCWFGSEETGNNYVVLFSEAAGSDLSTVISGAGVPNAGSYAAAKAALAL